MKSEREKKKKRKGKKRKASKLREDSQVSNILKNLSKVREGEETVVLLISWMLVNI